VGLEVLLSNLPTTRSRPTAPSHHKLGWTLTPLIRSNGYSRKLSNHRYAIALFVTAYNFCKVHTTLGCTPAVGLKLATETWTIERLIEEATK
jgi:hypothetical protein